MADISLIVAFIAGIVSFLSPCVLPIVPGFLAYLAGTSANVGTGASAGAKVDAVVNDRPAARRKETFLNALFFVLGFSAVFAILGVLLNTLLESIAYDVQLWLSRIGGAVIIFFGLYLVGLVRIGFLEREHKLAVKKRFGSRYATSFIFGSAFAAGWTPCVGAALGAILGLAAAQPGTAAYLLFSYALGLGMPFLLVGIFTAGAQSIINRSARILKYVNIIFGVVLIVLGVLVFTQSLNLIANFELLNRIFLE